MSPSHNVTRIPEAMGPQEIGPYLCALREHFSLSRQDVSERLHIRVRYVGAMEEGRFDAMPGKVYARGYLHTYAEFLGLDAEQVVAQCFPANAPEPASSTAAKIHAPVITKPAPSTYSPVPPPLMRDPHPRKSRGTILAGFAILAVILGYILWGGTAEKPVASEATVAEVPDTLLASVRSLVMPRASNYACLTGSLALSCFFAHADTHMLQTLETYPIGAEPYLHGIDFNALALSEPAGPAAEDQPPESAGHD